MVSIAQIPDLDEAQLPLQIQHRAEGPVSVLVMVGEADLATRSLLERELAGLGTDHHETVIDVSGLAFCGVDCAQLVLAAAVRATVAVVGATGSVKRVFDLLDPMIQGLPAAG
jgi:anti-anti-sigma regulatory factor